MGKLKPVSKRDNRTKGVSLTVGVDGRMYLSQGLKQLLEHKEKTGYILFYDETDNRIGLAKEFADSNIDAFSFNARGEGVVVTFIEDCEIQIPGKPVVWLYEGKEDGVYVFYQKGRHKTSLRQEKNGNLERLG